MSITCPAMDWIRLDSKFDSDLQTSQRPPAPGQKSSGSTWDLPRRRSPRRGVGFSVEIRLRLEGCWKNIRCFRVFFRSHCHHDFGDQSWANFPGFLGQLLCYTASMEENAGTFEIPILTIWPSWLKDPSRPRSSCGCPEPKQRTRIGLLGRLLGLGSFGSWTRLTFGTRCGVQFIGSLEYTQ